MQTGVATLNEHERERAPCSHLVEFRPSSIDGLGGFALRSIARGVRVMPYVGETISKAESLERCAAGNNCIFYLDESRDLDGDTSLNPARWLNHSCAPNCEVTRVDDALWIIALRDIVPEEELTFDYGYGLEELAEHPCRCGASHCAGFIVARAFHDLVRRRTEHARSRWNSSHK